MPGVETLDLREPIWGGSMHSNTRARSASLITLVAAIAIAVAAFAAPAQAASADSGLGTKTPAKGTPVKIGLITDGKTSGTDNSIETPVSEAAVKWINQYRNGVGGHPIDLDICTNNGDPSKSADCANQMIQDDVAAVVFGSNQFSLNAWTPLHDAGVPVFIFGSGTPDLLEDTASTFIMRFRFDLREPHHQCGQGAEDQEGDRGRDRRARGDADLRRRDALREGRPGPRRCRSRSAPPT